MMKAIAKCPECKEMITSNCRSCIDSGSCKCSAEHSSECEWPNNLGNVEWKKVPETEEELNEVEEI